MAWQDYLERVQEIYIAYYQRPADPTGLVYWAQRLDLAGGNLDQIIDAFATSEEANALYGEINEDTIGDVIDAIYQAAFNRAPDDAGKQFYIDGFGDKFTAATIMLNIIDGAQNDDKLVLENKVDSAMNFTKAIDPELDGRDLQATYEGNDDAQAARDFLKEVGATIDTVKTTEDAQSFIKEKIADEGDPILSEQIISGNTFTLTKDLDSVEGTTNDDVINAVIYPGSTSDNTWNTADSIDGKAGTDTIKAQVINEATKTVAGLSASNVEKVEFKHVDGNASADTTFTVDVGNISGLQEVWVSNGSSYNTGNDTTTDDTLKISNISSGVKFGVANNDANLKVVAEYASAATSGTSDEANIVLGGGTTGEVDLGAGFEKVNIEVTDASTVNAMDLSSGGTATLKEVNITGDKNVTIKSLTGFKTTADYTVDASQATGKVTLGLVANTHLTAKGGSGTDIEDVLTLDLQNQTVTTGMSISGFETLKLIDTLGNGTLKYSLIDGVDNLQIKGTTTNLSTNVITLQDVSAGTAVNFVGTGKDQAQYFNGLTYKLANYSGTADSVNISVNNAGTATSSTKAATIGNITTTQIENVTMDFADFSKVTVNNFADTTLKSLTINGSADITFASGTLATSVTNVDASGASGDIDWGTLFNNVGFTKDLTFKGSSGADTIANSPAGTAGKTMDFDLGDGNDKFVLNNAPAGTNVLKLDGGAGTDVLNATTSATVAYFDNFEEIDNQTATLTLKVPGGYNDTVKIVEVSTGAAALTFESLGGDVDLSHLTFVGWTVATDTLTLKGSANAESLTGSSVADIIQGGKGADTITTGTGADKVVLDSPFAAADKIKDFASGTDTLKIDLTTEGTLALAAGKFGGDNAVDAAYTSGKKLQVLQFTTSNTGGKLVKSIVKVTGTLTGTGKATLTGTLWLKGKSITFGSKSIKLNGTKTIKTLAAAPTATVSKDGVLFFYDTDDHVLKMYGLKVTAKTGDAIIDKVSKLTVKTIAQFTAGHEPAATDIVIF
ncbi:MAG: hypothetical protein JRI45_06165 [Deltaproteobacteria bacterium]|nr:hypothetical protein [Deltaproteobacteria bacterium]MBW2069285.1 hypothetical protein [Deltaproteobacteria bacterium]